MRIIFVGVDGVIVTGGGMIVYLVDGLLFEVSTVFSILGV